MRRWDRPPSAVNPKAWPNPWHSGNSWWCCCRGFQLGRNEGSWVMQSSGRPTYTPSALLLVYVCWFFWEGECVSPDFYGFETVGKWHVDNLIIFDLFIGYGQNDRKKHTTVAGLPPAMRTLGNLLYLNKVILNWILKVDKVEPWELIVDAVEELVDELKIWRVVRLRTWWIRSWGTRRSTCGSYLRLRLGGLGSCWPRCGRCWRGIRWGLRGASGGRWPGCGTGLRCWRDTAASSLWSPALWNWGGQLIAGLIVWPCS